MSEVLSPRERRYWMGVEVAYASNEAYDDLKAAEAAFNKYVGTMVENIEMAQAAQTALLEVTERQMDFDAYCTAAGELLLPKQLRIIYSSSEAV